MKYYLELIWKTTALEQSDDYIQGSHLLQSINRVLRMN